jgi:hypothetical protein
VDRSGLLCGLVADGSGSTLADCAAAGCCPRHSRFSCGDGTGSRTSGRSGFWNSAEDCSTHSRSASNIAKDCATASEQAFSLSARRDRCNTGCAAGGGTCHSARRGYGYRSSATLSSGGTEPA